MYIISLTYKVSLEEVDNYLNDHIVYLNQQYELGNFHASGRKVPRTGGIILSKLANREKLEAVIAKDPFKIHNVADYEITGFIASKTCDELSFLKET